ncbi:MAG: hypothetical protein UX24_C0004G0003 [Candidatus Giovannonibacteria bacterium GW2011_GWB1_45_9b]|uniref:POTRA domain-containing protein n=1 Tax=Candidatus Giovannonibacteria bacterium GW2011_GWB1_45_9b TaxID=1618653 RepID=A0A0G1N8Q3_9BACT|nr:MAG: hypothetical protein UX24_C0004G0003 [Candidatus Giovannonibacteria bacterium GW2011_GWB1_45_9b]
MSLRQDLLKTFHKRRQKGVFIKILLWVGILGIVSAMATLLFYVPPLRVSKVNIFGLDKNDEKQLRAEILEIIAGKKWLIVPRDHVFFLSQKDIEEFLAGKYRFSDFAVERKFPSAIDVSITERKTWAIWCPSDLEAKLPRGSLASCLLLDKEGLAFEKSVISSGSAVLKILDAREEDFLRKNILPPEHFGKISQMIENIPKIIESDIVKVYIKKGGETYYLYPKKGFYLIIDAQTDIEKAIENFSLALRSGEIKKKSDTLEYIDLRFQDKVFYKFK